jgi:hypothetical protein
MLECCCGISLHAIHSPMKRMLRALVSFTSIVLSASTMTYKGTNDKIEDESGENVRATAAGYPSVRASRSTAAAHGL